VRGIVPAIPRARRLAAENGVDLGELHGSGAGGAVLVSDVRAHLDRTRDAAPPDVPPRTAVPQPTAQQPATSQPASPQAAASPPAAPAAAGSDALWAARAAALAPRPGPVGGASAATTLWRDAVLPTDAPADAADLLPALLVALSQALAADGPPHVRRRPRAGLAVTTPAGPVTVTFSDLHRLPRAGAEDAVRAAAQQARDGLVDVGLLAPPDAVVTWVADAQRVDPPAPEGPLVAVGAGNPTPRVVPVGDGVGVRTVVTLAATAMPHADVAWVGRLLARTAEAFRLTPWSERVSMTESSRS
jgi:pyruvate dehydrogenase E2 component (dihydrolipoamide acetyltransferase)